MTHRSGRMNAAAEEQIQEIRRRLDHGAEELTRSVLLKLFLDEEKMLGLTQEQLRRIDRHIAKLRRLISEQAKRTDRLASLGIDTEGRRLVLATLNDLLAAYH